MIALCRGFGVKTAETPDKTPAKRQQQVGEYCGGQDLAECQAMFGEALPRVCSTCPN